MKLKAFGTGFILPESPKTDLMSYKIYLQRSAWRPASLDQEAKVYQHY